MPRTWDSLITVLSEITRKNCVALVCCPHCGNRHTYIKWGFYSRYLFNDEMIYAHLKHFQSFPMPYCQ